MISSLLKLEFSCCMKFFLQIIVLYSLYYFYVKVVWYCLCCALLNFCRNRLEILEEAVVYPHSHFPSFLQKWSC